MLHKTDLNRIGKALFYIPFLMKYSEKHITKNFTRYNTSGDEYEDTYSYDLKGYQIRIFHPVGIFIFLFVATLLFIMEGYRGLSEEITRSTYFTLI